MLQYASCGWIGSPWSTTFNLPRFLLHLRPDDFSSIRRNWIEPVKGLGRSRLRCDRYRSQPVRRRSHLRRYIHVDPRPKTHMEALISTNRWGRELWYESCLAHANKQRFWTIKYN